VCCHMVFLIKQSGKGSKTLCHCWFKVHCLFFFKWTFILENYKTIKYRLQTANWVQSLHFGWRPWSLSGITTLTQKMLVAKEEMIHVSWHRGKEILATEGTQNTNHQSL
jgi:hypothetical protein